MCKRQVYFLKVLGVCLSLQPLIGSQGDLQFLQIIDNLCGHFLSALEEVKKPEDDFTLISHDAKLNIQGRSLVELLICLMESVHKKTKQIENK